MEARLEKLELLYMQQEQTIETLSQQLYLQQQEIRHLLLQMEQLKERMKAMASSIVATAAEETPPPHDSPHALSACTNAGTLGITRYP